MNRTKKMLIAGALVLAGFGGGAALAISGTASAANDDSTSRESSSARGHAGETPLTGTTAAKVKAAALAKYPGASINRLETDSDGVYEAHLTTTAGDNVTVHVDKAFKVTGTQTGGGHGGRGHRAGETPLTGTTADKVKAAALAKYPGAAIDRLETDSDGVYEAHMTTKAGDHVTVEVDKAFKVTETHTGGEHEGRGHHDGEGPEGS